ncbi:MAG: CHRD domain-containing protein [Gammaproteobacteria bacterium]|nr:CHRD domain-containing protein [Gammaproteobacteria bacterium]
MAFKPAMLLSVVVAAVALAACGSSSKSTSSSTPSSSASSTGSSHTTSTGLPSRTYKLKLTGTSEVPKGAPSGVGNAVVTIHGKTGQLCWRFSHLHGFNSATFAHVHVGAAGTSGNIVVPLSTGTALHHAGCVKVSPTLLKAIEANPHGYYVNIHSKVYPGGAVRSQL